jgi:hypothetical protein
MIINSSPVQGQKPEIDNNDDKSSLWTSLAFPPKALNRVLIGRSPGLLPFFRLPRLLARAGQDYKKCLASANGPVACDSEKRLDTKLTVAGTAPESSVALTGVPF